MAGKSTDWRPGHTVCRCCFADGCYKDISTEYFWMGKREVYSEMLNETFDVSIAYSQSTGPNSNSRLICEPCIARLRDASDFKRQVLECERTFMHHLDPGRPSTSEIEVSLDFEPSREEVKLERVKLEAKLSDDDFDDDRGALADDGDDDDDLDDQPLTTLASKVPKKEAVDLLDLLDNSKRQPEKRKSTTKVKPSPSKKTKKKEMPKPSASKPTIKTTATKKKDTEVHNAIIILNHSTAYPFKLNGKSIQCCFCSNCYDDPSMFREHMDTAHRSVDRTSYCVAHRKKFGSLIRVDITNLRCKYCIKIFPSLESLAKHLKEEHDLVIYDNASFGVAPMKLQLDRFDCVLCPKKFYALIQYSRHASTHFLRHICDVCGKNFEALSALRHHKKQDHKLANVCNVCNKTFPSVEARRQHRKVDKSCLPSKCSLCDERFPFWERREEHLVDVHGKSRSHRCGICGKTFEKRKLLYFHFKEAHTDDHKCKYCERRFPTRERVESHTAYNHTGELPFHCPVCDRRYATKKAYHKHNICHDDSRKSACSACDRMFTRKARLRDHIQRHHPDIYNQEFKTAP